ncbi:MAG: tRNA (cytidine(34)-2'-O)-methyltransferase [Pseudomonadota bacterium]
MIQLALFQPEIPQNTGTMLRLAACWGIDVNIIGPCGFIWSERRLKRAGMDYINHVCIQHHSSWMQFKEHKQSNRLILLTPQTEQSYLDFCFAPNDYLMVGQESSGVPENVFEATDAQVKIPMRKACRSLNVALSAAIVLGEAMRQLDLIPGEKS